MTRFETGLKRTAARLLAFAVFTTAFAPVFAGARPVRIMPLGDSLTSSIDGQASYRYLLYRKLVGTGFRVDFVGTQWGVGSGTSGPEGFDQDHEGHPGATTDDILANVQNWASQTRPDIVLLLVGGTDFEHGYTVSHVFKNSLRIIAKLRSVNPNVKILWALLPPAPDQIAEAKAYNSRVLRLGMYHSLPNSPVRIVNLWSNFKPDRDTVDGDHPNALGERKFANRFFVGLFQLLLYPGI